MSGRPPNRRIVPPEDRAVAMEGAPSPDRRPITASGGIEHAGTGDENEANASASIHTEEKRQPGDHGVENSAEEGRAVETGSGARGTASTSRSRRGGAEWAVCTRTSTVGEISIASRLCIRLDLVPDERCRVRRESAPSRRTTVAGGASSTSRGRKRSDRRQVRSSEGCEPRRVGDGQRELRGIRSATEAPTPAQSSDCRVRNSWRK